MSYLWNAIQNLSTAYDSTKNFFNGITTDNVNSFTNNIGSNLNNATGVTASNAFNAEEAQKQRAWEEEMSNTQYQRTVADMQKAGLNPTALYGGAGLTTLGSSQAATSSGNSASALGSILNALTGLVKTARGGSKYNTTKNFYYQKK